MVFSRAPSSLARHAARGNGLLAAVGLIPHLPRTCRKNPGPPAPSATWRQLAALGRAWSAPKATRATTVASTDMQRACRSPGPPTWGTFISYDTYIFDCDGVIWGIGPDDTKTSVETINHLLQLGKRVMFITNNSNKRRQDFLKELETWGISFAGRTEADKLGMMISASYTTAQYLAKEGLRRPFVITSDTGVLEELRLAGISNYLATVDDEGRPLPEFESPMMNGSSPEIADIIARNDDVDCIVVGWDMGLSARKIATAVNFIRFHEDVMKGTPGFKPLPIVACSGDASGVFKTASYKGHTVKVRAIGNGAMAEFLAKCFDPPREWLDMGKPSENLLEQLANPAIYGVEFRKTLMVGDTIQTDIVFGNKGGMETLLVLTGVTTAHELDEEVTAGRNLRVPTYVMPKLGAWVERDGSLPPKADL